MNFFIFIVTNTKHSDWKIQKNFLRKKTFTKEINLGQIKNEPKTCLYLYDYTLSFFWNSLDFLKISSILLHFLQISSPKLVGPPQISFILLYFEFEKHAGALVQLKTQTSFVNNMTSSTNKYTNKQLSY